MGLQQDLVKQFATESMFTPKQVLEWYQQRKSGGLAYINNVYQLLLIPLLAKGQLVRVGRGLYRVQHGRSVQSEANPDDTWMQYINQRIAGKKEVKHAHHKQQSSDRDQVQSSIAKQTQQRKEAKNGIQSERSEGSGPKAGVERGHGRGDVAARKEKRSPSPSEKR